MRERWKSIVAVVANALLLFEAANATANDDVMILISIRPTTSFAKSWWTRGGARGSECVYVS